MAVLNLYNERHDAWISIRLTYGRSGRIGTDFVSGGLHDMGASSTPGYTLEMKTNASTRNEIINDLREALKSLVGSYPSVMPTTFASGMTEFRFDSTLSETEIVVALKDAMTPIALNATAEVARSSPVSEGPSEPESMNQKATTSKPSVWGLTQDEKSVLIAINEGMEDVGTFRRDNASTLEALKGRGFLHEVGILKKHLELTEKGRLVFGAPRQVALSEHDALQVVYEGYQSSLMWKYRSLFDELAKAGLLKKVGDQYQLTPEGEQARRDSAGR